MTIEQFNAMLPVICANLIQMIAESENITEREAIFRLYSSKLYRLLEQENTKLWQYSTSMLYSLLTEERNLGTLSFPDV